jgi:transposase-like protein
MSMHKEDFLSSDFLSQFKTGEELSGFLKEIQKRGIEKILEAELDAHLDYVRHEKTVNGNARNGTSRKLLKTSLGESEIAVPRDRNATFNPMIVPKR